MPVMNFDLEDGLPPVNFALSPEDAERFMAFMDECHEIKNSMSEQDMIDALRYRFIRDDRFIGTDNNYMTKTGDLRISIWCSKVTKMKGEVLDRAIDKARAAQEKS